MPASAIRGELDRVLRSRVFVHSHRIRRFLQFVVEECLASQQHRLKEYLIGLEVFNRQETFDPRVDSIVRVEARRLRAKLDEFYLTEGRDDEIRIELRKGSYVPLFEYRRSGSPGYGSGITPVRRSSVAIARLSHTNGETPELISEITRRLTHVLINESFCQVVAGAEPGAQDGDGLVGLPAARPDFRLEGSVQQHDADIQVMLRLVSLSEGAYLWSESGPAAEIERLARSMNRAMVTSHSNHESSRLQRHRGDHQSFDNYMHGRYLCKLASPESIRGSVAPFTKAIERDPSYGAAWAALSEALIVSAIFGFVSPRETYVRIKEAAQKAVELNDSSPEAHIALGAALSLFDRNWEVGEREFQKALQLDSRDPTAHVAYGLQLACRGLLRAAEAEIERALELDPASLSTNFVLGWLRSITGRYDEAIAQHSLVSKLAPDYSLAYLGLGWAHLGKEMFQDAVAHFTNAGNLSRCRTLLSGALGHCYARMGQPDEALRQLAQLTSQMPSQFTSAVSIAAVYSGLGDLDRAFSYLEQAFEAGDCCLPIQMLNPEFDPLRADPRYGQLAARLGLAYACATA